ncbi:MAG: metalloregulator ArsR/SmtB family transcription factor [Acidobacteria bacterium]|nr:metalloregulator ArsR/SmtB family transcription factor [Acidobacteriota bacterium]
MNKSSDETHRAFKDAIYGQFVRIGKAISTPRRLELLDLLRQAPRTVEELARETGQSVANTSHHLHELRSHGLVESEKNGLYVTYRIAGEEVFQFLSSLQALAESQLADIRRITEKFVADQGPLEGVDRQALLERVKKRGVIVLDVRPREEYDAGHLRGAISLPLPELKRRLKKLPRDREIVAYCRGRYCLMAVQAVEFLRAKGYQATRVDLGVPEWRELGFPIETTAKELGL